MSKFSITSTVTQNPTSGSTKIQSRFHSKRALNKATPVLQSCSQHVSKTFSGIYNGIKRASELMMNFSTSDDIGRRYCHLCQLAKTTATNAQRNKRSSLKVGLSTNLKKTKIMHNKHKNDNNNREVVDHYIYLGQLIIMNSTSKEREIKRRITMGWQSFGRASSIFKNQDIPIIQKRQVYDQCITPTVTYGAETWNLTKKQTLKLRTMQRAHERIMLNIRW